MDLNFNVRFIINRVDNLFKIEITDQTQYSLPGTVKGFYKITYPDGVFMENTDQNNPDFDLDSPVALFNLRLINVRPIKGSYTIVQKIYVDNTLFTEEQTFTFSFEEPQLVLEDNSNTGTPQVSFKDITNLFVDSYTIDSSFRDITSEFPEAISLPALSTDEEILLMSDNGSFYEGIYRPVLTWEVEYIGSGHNVYLEYSKQFQFDIRRVLQFNELVQLLNLLKQRLDNSAGQERGKLEQMYQQLVSLYTHVIAKTRANESDVRGLIDEMQKIAYMACCYCVSPDEYTYSTNPLEPFEDKIFEFVRRQVFEFTGNNTFELSLVPLKIFQVFRNGKLMVLEDVEYEIDGRNVTILEPMVLGDEIVIFYTLQENTYILDLEDYAERAEAAALSAEADAVQTGLDRIATGEDRVQTGLDVIATNADALQTAADRVQTGLDVIATNADAAQTESDRIAAENAKNLAEQYRDEAEGFKDAASGFADDAEQSKIAAEAAAALTEADAIQTAQDVITTGQNKTDAEAAANTSTEQAILSAAARDAAEGFANDAVAAKIAAEDAQDNAEGFRDESEGFRDEALIYKTDAEDASVLSTEQAILSSAARDDAEAFKIASQLARDESIAGMVSLTSSGMPLLFDNNRVYGYPTAVTGNLTVDNTTAKQGLVTIVRHNDVTTPTFPVQFKNVGGTYFTATDNLIYINCVYVDVADTSNNVYHYIITREA